MSHPYWQRGPPLLRRVRATILLLSKTSVEQNTLLARVTSRYKGVFFIGDCVRRALFICSERHNKTAASRRRRAAAKHVSSANEQTSLHFRHQGLVSGNRCGPVTQLVATLADQESPPASPLQLVLPLHPLEASLHRFERLFDVFVAVGM